MPSLINISENEDLINRARTVLQKSGYHLSDALLSKGNHGFLMDCEKIVSERKLAVKIIEHKILSKEYFQKFFSRELSLIQRLRHLNILRAYKILSMEDFTCIVIQKELGGDLIQYVTFQPQGFLQEPLARHIFHGLLSAVQFLHTMKIAHRNLKCDNIVMGLCSEPKIQDFGFARKMVDPVTKKRIFSDTYCGTAAYAAPEVMRGIPYDAMLVDVWSLGIILFVMVTGRLPFDDSNMAKLIRMQSNKQFSFPLGTVLSQDLTDLMNSMLQPETTQRAPLNDVICHKWLKS